MRNAAPDSLATAIILAGGQGTRLRPLTDALPKPLLPVAGRPLLEHIVAGLREQGIQRVVLATGYRAEAIRHHFQDGRAFGVEFRYVVENEPLGSGGALHQVFERYPDCLNSTFLVTNADVLNNADLNAAFNLHRAKLAMATILCGHVEDAAGFGICEVEDDGRVARFLEKPARGVTASRWANLGWWIFEPQLATRLQAGFSRIEDTLLPQLIAENQPVYAYRHEGYWLDVGTHERYAQAERDAQAGRFAVARRMARAV